MSNQKLLPTDAELEVLQILWQYGPQTVRFVNDEVNKSREVGYTTTLKIMQIMLDKGLVSRIIEGRSHIFSAVVEEAITQGEILDQVLDATFRGSASSMVMRLLGNDKTELAELQKIKSLIDEHLEGK